MARQKIKTTKIFTGFSTIDNNAYQTKVYDLDLVKRDILNALMTRRGERVMNPLFGSIIWQLLFEPFTQNIQQQILADVQRIINNEPRVELIDVQITNDDQGITLSILLNYVPFNVIDTLYARFVRENFNTIVTERDLDDL